MATKIRALRSNGQRRASTAGSGARLWILGLCLLWLFAGSAKSVANDGDASGFQLLSRNFLGQPNDVLTSAGLAFVALDTGIEVFDISDPASPLGAGGFYLPGPALNLSLDGDYLYVACGEAGLQILDVRDPSALAWVSAVPSEGITDVVAQNGIAYLAESVEPPVSTYGLAMMDVSDPLLPAPLGYLALPNGPLTLTVSGQNVYLGLGADPGGFHGLVAADVSNPSAPVILGSLETEKRVYDIEVVGANEAALAMGFSLSGAVATINLATSLALEPVGMYRLDDTAYALKLDGTMLHVAAGIMGLVRLDASDPSSLTFAGSVFTGRDTRAVAVDGDMAFVGSRGYNLEGAFEVIPTGSLDVSAALPYSDATDAQAVRGTAYFLSRDGLTIHDATNPVSITQVGEWRPPGADLAGLCVQGTLAAVAEGCAVHLLELSDPAAPALLGDVVLTTEMAAAIRPVLSGNTLYVINGQGFEAFDITNPTSPVLLGVHTTSGYSSDLFVDGSTGYLTAGAELSILDLSSPGSPALLGSYKAPGNLFAVAVQDGMAMVTGLDTLLMLVDVTTPSSPTLMANMTGWNGFDVLAARSHALVAAGEAGVAAINIADPFSPFLEAYYDTAGVATTLAEYNRTVFLGTGMGQHWTFNCEVCAPQCEVFAEILPSEPVSICEGSAFLLSAGFSSFSECPDGLSYEWYEDGAPLPGGTQSDYTIPSTHQPGIFVFRVDATCSSDLQCTGSAQVSIEIVPELWPTVRPNSLRITPQPDPYGISWELVSGSGEFNVHSAMSKLDVTDLYTDPASVALISDQLTVVESFMPSTPGGVAYYRVFGRGSCTGLSHP